VVDGAVAFVLFLLLILAGRDVFGPPLDLSVIVDFTDGLTAEEDDLFALRLGLVTVSLTLPSSTDKAAKALLLMNRDMTLESIYRMIDPDHSNDVDCAVSSSHLNFHLKKQPHPFPLQR
jgi:hypothetical protein